MADKADGVGIDLAAEECHGSACAEAAGVNVVCGEPEVGKGVCRLTEYHGEVIGCEGEVAAAPGISAQRGGGCATTLAESDTPFGEGVDGACGGVTTAGVADDFAPFTIFLVVECDGDMRRPVQVRGGGRGGVEFLVPYGEGDVAQA